jgi:large repetitive protein
MPSNSNPVGSEFQANSVELGEQQASLRSVAIDQDGDFVVTWESRGQDGDRYGIYARRFNVAGEAQGDAFQVNTTTVSNQRSSKVAIDQDGDFVVTWESYDSDENYGIYAQRYSAAGIAQGGEFLVNTPNFNDQRQANIDLSETGDFVITWTSNNQDGGGSGVYAQRYNAVGEAQGSEFRVNTTTTRDQLSSSVAIASDGSFVVIWTSFGQSGGNQADVYFQRFSAAGVPLGSETRVNTFITDSQQDATVAIDPAGNFVVTWSSLNQNGSNSQWDIYAQRYNAAGEAQGSEIRVNSLITGIQRYSTVSIDQDGDFMVSWSGQGSGGYGVYARRYNAAGLAQGSEFRVNTTSAIANQKNATVALDADGDAIVTWAQSDGSGNGIFGQLYKASELPSTTGIADIQLPENSENLLIDLFAAFEDVETPDASLTYTIVTNNFPVLFANGTPAIDPVAGKLILDFAPDAVGIGNLTIRATDQDGLYIDASFRVELFSVDDPPAIAPITTPSIAYSEQAPGVAIATSVTLADDQNAIAGATLKIINVADGDLLNFTTQNGISGSYSAGVLTLTGSASLASYQVAVRSVTYSNSSDTPSTADRTIEISVSDGTSNSSPASRTVTVAAVNDAPVVTTAGSITYTEGDLPTAIVDDPNTLTLSDPDNTTLASATVAIVNFVPGQDVLSFTNQIDIVGDFNSTTGVLTLSRTSALVNYQTALQSVTYSNTSPTPDTTDRIIRFQVNDGGLNSNLGDRTVRVFPINAAPVITSSSGIASYTENAAALAIDSGLTVSDLDSPTLTGATVQISNGYVAEQDFLNFVDQFGIVDSFNATTATLTLSGTATVANYQTALQSVTYFNNSDNPSTATRTIEFQVNDGFALSNLGDRELTVIAVNDLPVVTLTNGTAAYIENAVGVAIDPGLTLTDLDNINLTGATVRISGNFNSGQDFLNFTGLPEITGSFDGSTGVLTLSGTTTIANYQTVLQSVTYFNNRDNPSLANRTIEFQLNDGISSGNAPTRIVTVAAVNDPPLLTPSLGAAAYTENEAARIVDAGLTIADLDSLTLTGATVRIGGNFVAGQDLLSFVSQPGIAGGFNAETGVLTLSGAATIADYQTVLRSVIYTNSSENPSLLDRTIQFQVSDGVAPSNLANRTVIVLAVNDAPSLTTSIEAIAYTEATPPIAIDSGMTVADIDSTSFVSAAIAIQNYVVGQDLLSFADQNGISGSFNSTTGVITLSGSALVADYQTALRSVSYSNTSSNPDLSDRILQIKINDGNLESNQGTRTVQVIPVDNAPIVITSSDTATYTENAIGVAIDSGLSLNDPDSNTLSGATVTLTNYVAGQDFLNFSSQLGLTGNFDAVSGVLKLTGPATLSDYQTALRSVTYFNSSDNPSTAGRLVQFQVNDGSNNSIVANRVVTIAAVNDAPTLTGSTGSILYIENNLGLAIDPGTAIADLDSPILTKATVRISNNYVVGQDFLNFTDQLGIAGSFDAATGTLTLSGAVSLADYQTALRTVTYFNNSDLPNALDRTVDFQVNDEALSSNLGSRTIQVFSTPEAPIVTTSGDLLLYRENDAAKAIDSGIVLSDFDSLTLVSASVQITNYIAGQDLLSFGDQLGIGGNFNSFTGTLTLAGTAPIANYQTALRSITYTNTSNNPDPTNRVVQFAVNDGGLVSNPSTRSIQITAVNTPPIVTASAATTAVYIEDATGVAIDGGLAIADVDSLTLASATVTLTNYVAGQDLLNFTDQNGISGSFDSSTGVLTLASTDVSVASYQAALRSVTYSNSSQNPSVGDRTIQFQINDGTSDSNLVSRTVTVRATNDVPLLTVSASADLVDYPENGTPSILDAGLLLSDVDSSNLASAVVRITNYVAGQDLLNFTPQNGITGDFDRNSGTLTLTGTAAIADYQTVLRSVTYSNNSTNPDLTNRSIVFTVNDGQLTSNSGTRTVRITPVNSPPVITTVSGTSAYIEAGAAVAIDSGLLINDFDSPNLTSATVSISNFVAGQDLLNFRNQFGIAGSFNTTTGVLALTGTALLFDYQSVLRSVTYSNSSDSPNLTDRTVQFQVNDGLRDSNITSRTVSVVPTNDAPTVTASIGSVAYTERGTAIALDTGLVLTDLDSANLASATVRIVNFVAGQDVLNFAGQGGISGNFDSSTGILTLTGGDTPANYQAALRSVTYTNSSIAPNTTSRTIQFQANDGNLSSTIATRILDVIPVNDSPSIAVSTTPGSYTENGVAVAIDGGLTLTDLDSVNFASATVSISNFVAGQDLLSFTPQSGIRGSFNNVAGILTLTGAASIASYQEALRSVTYANSSDNPNAIDRTIQFVVNDGISSSNVATQTLQVVPTNDTPILTASSGLIEFSLGAGAVVVDNGLLIRDADSPDLIGAAVTIGGFVANQDLLNFTSQSGISGSFSAGVLQLTGSASIATYQNVLRSITYSNTSLTPSATTRDIRFQVSDGAATSNLGTRSIQVTANNNPPEIDLNGADPTTGFTATYILNNPPVRIVDTDLSVVDIDSPTFSSAVVVITNPLNWPQERLEALTTGTGITADYNAAGGRLTLIGTAPRTVYQQVLRSVTYINSAIEPDLTTRTIVFTVDDGDFTSNLTTSTVSLSSVRTVNGTAGNDLSLVTTPTTDAINALGGNDIVTSNLANLQQNDAIDGGLDTDTFVLTDGTGTANVNVASSIAQITGLVPATTTIVNFERFDFSRFLGQSTMMGSDALDDMLMGGVGQNTIAGAGGNDTLTGNVSDDRLTGGVGNDRLTGDAGNDTLDGGSGTDSLTSGAGNDTLDGGSGTDAMTGGSGDDFYVVDDSSDLAIEDVDAGIDTVQSSASFVLGENLESLTLTTGAIAGTGNALNNTITGNDLDNTLVGNLGNDILVGSSGNDLITGDAGEDNLTGGSGIDRLTGGQGRDSFFLTSARKADREVIVDFTSKDDAIFVSKDGFSQTLNLGKITRSQLRLGAAALDQNDNFIYRRGTGALFFDIDGSGRAAKIKIATIVNKSLLAGSDIIVV